jgi:hypothetical protein
VTCVLPPAFAPPLENSSVADHHHGGTSENVFQRHHHDWPLLSVPLEDNK